MKLGLAFLCLLLMSCSSSNKSSESSAWSGQMQGMAGEVEDLLPYIYGRQAFVAPENRAKIDEGMARLSTRAHAISPEMGQIFYGPDPLVKYTLENLQADIARAREAFKAGQMEYSQSMMKAAFGNCFQCHSLTKVGAKAHWDLGKISQLSLAPLERVDLNIASRRYDHAITELETTLTSPQFLASHPFDFEMALRKYLSLMIRTENNPERAFRELNRIIKQENIPAYVMHQAQAWSKSLQAWAGKKSKKSKDLLADASGFLKRARQIQEFPKDHAGDIELLRVTSSVHEFLRQNKKSPRLAEAYFLLGQAYEVLDDLGDWNLHETYYESCIRGRPRSTLSQSCYSRLEASVFLGYSGSSGVHVPKSEIDRLKYLKSLSL